MCERRIFCIYQEEGKQHFTGQIPSNLCSNQGKIPKRKEMQDGRKAEKPSRYRYIRAVGKRLHQSIPRRSCRSKFWFASGVRSFYKHPKILWFCARQCCPPQDGYQHEGRKPVYGFSHLGPMPVVSSKNKQGKEVYTILNNLPQGDVLNTHQSWFEERFNVELRPQN